MDKRATWRSLLGKHIENPREKQRIADALAVHPMTLTRWVNGETNPRSQYLQRLLAALPQMRSDLLLSIQEEFPDIFIHMRQEAKESVTITIPSTFYACIFHTYVSTPDILRFSSLCDLILQQALKHLDPLRLGMAIIVSQCVPPANENKVRSLREVAGRGTPPWKANLEQHALLLGSESLAGYAVLSGHLVTNPALRDVSSLHAGYRGEWEESAVAAPIMRGSKIAGSLLISSTQPNNFSQDHLTIIQCYAEMLGLAFANDTYYDQEQIDLRLLPYAEVQQRHLANFQQRLIACMTSVPLDHPPISFIQAEQMVWQQLEEELLQLPPVNL